MTFNFLYTGIGRGHPYYLDGIIECLPADRIGSVTDVFSATSGLARQAWELARATYLHGGRGYPYSVLYNRLRGRHDPNRRSLARAIMGRPLRRRFADDPTPLVVAHPILTAMLRGKPNLYYQHGEIAAPRESWVKGRHRTLVPLERTADRLLAAGLDPKSIFVSGLCIEPALLAQAGEALHARLERLAGSSPLCGAFFSSGAEPREHLERLAAAALSAVESGGRAVVFARRSGRLAARVASRFAAVNRDLDAVRSQEALPTRPPQAMICLFDGRRELDELTSRLFGAFDYFAAPSHERTNWALGLGLPMFIVDPPLGSFAPLNREFLLGEAVATLIGDRRDASDFGDSLARLRSGGRLRAMAEAGWGRFDVRGFHNIAEMLGSP